ncbi:MAG TPA: rhomboid family intramembrane serine protease [Allosphingosinicella sp.]|nr:rhomboid family intramembrane serine protease [Allosphingosinicella sp.]
MRPPESWRTARATLAIAAGTAVAFVLAEMAGVQLRAMSWAGFLPYRFSFDGYGPGAPLWLTPLTATLVHIGWVHLLFNLLFLLFCGRAVEGVLGPVAIVLLYVLGAYAAAAGHFAFDPHSTAPMIGASGAISAVLGAYAMLFGRNKVRVKSPTLALWLQALWLMAAWIGLQVGIGIVSRQLNVGVAIGAHIGGFLVGIALARPLLLFRYRRA